MSELATRIVAAVLADLREHPGIESILDSLAPEAREELLQEIAAHVDQVIGETA